MKNVSRLPDCYRKDEAGNNFKLLEINQQAAYLLTSDTKMVLETLNLNSAIGKTLDLYGETLQRLRGNFTDSQYRYALYAQIGKNHVTGDYESVMSALVMMFGLEIGQITASDFELVEDEERCLVRLKKYPEVLEEAGFSIHEIYEMIKNLLPICVALLIQFYYWFDVLIRYEVGLRMRTEFYPRYNMAYHHLEGAHCLDGSKYLNGYDADTLVDFYPVVQTIAMDVRQDTDASAVLRSLADVHCKTAADVESTANMEVAADISLSNAAWFTGDVLAPVKEELFITTLQEVNVATRYDNSMEIRGDVLEAVNACSNHRAVLFVASSCDICAGTSIYTEVESKTAAAANCAYYRAEVSAVPSTSVRVEVIGGYPVKVDYWNGLTTEKNLRYLDGSGMLDGNNLLNADIFNDTL